MKTNQEKLREIKKSLNSTFSILTDIQDVTRFIDRKMNGAIIYTNRRCENIYSDAVNEIELRVNNEYKSLAKQINEIIDDININLSVYASNDKEYSKNDIKHVAVGAAAGLGAAIVLGGPALWLAAIGAGIAGIYNSSQKKNSLVTKIVEFADKYNNEAKSKLLESLDKLILPVIDAPIIEVKPVQIASLSSEQATIKNFLESRGIKFLVHFTDAKNYFSIMKNGLLSINEAKRRNIHIDINDNDISSHKIENKLKIAREDYLSLSVTRTNDDLLSRFKCEGIIKNIKVFYIDASILWKEIDNDRIYCDKNASTNSVNFGRCLSDFKNMFVDHMSYSTFKKDYDYDRVFLQDNMTTDPKAEIWYKGRIDPKYIVEEQKKNPDLEDLF